MIRLDKKIVLLFVCLLLSSLWAKEKEWMEISEMPIPVAGGEAIAYNGKIYIFGGFQAVNDAPISTIQVFDPYACTEQQWDTVGHMHVPRSNFVARLYNDTVYISGGATGYDQENVSSMEMWGFKNANEAFKDDAMLNRIGATGEIWNGIFLIIGGYYHDRPSMGAGYIVGFHLGLNRLIGAVPAFSGQEPYNQASVITDDVIYIFGGIRSGVSNRIYKLDLGKLTWDGQRPRFPQITPRIQPDLRKPRSSMEAVVAAPDTVWLIGGHNEDYNALDTVSKFIITSYGYKHAKAPSLNFARKELMAAKLDSVIYVFGGLNQHDEVLSSVEAFVDTVIYEPCNTRVVQKEWASPSHRLLQNYPNPFNASTTIEFNLTGTELVRLDIFSSTGQRVHSLVHNELAPGQHRYVWDGTSVDGTPQPSGVYLYKLTTATETKTRKMLLVK